MGIESRRSLLTEHASIPATHDAHGSLIRKLMLLIHNTSSLWAEITRWSLTKKPSEVRTKHLVAEVRLLLKETSWPFSGSDRCDPPDVGILMILGYPLLPQVRREGYLYHSGRPFMIVEAQEMPMGIHGPVMCPLLCFNGPLCLPPSVQKVVVQDSCVDQELFVGVVAIEL